MKKFISILVAFAIITTMFCPVLSAAKSEPSSWAVEEVNLAKENGLVTDSLMEDYSKDVTREEFCELVVKLYEKITGTKLTPSANIFVDTDNEEILKAYNIGIVKGVSPVQFDPSAPITRQELCVMMTRCIEHAIATSTVYVYNISDFKDGDLISDWAKPSVYYSYDHEIIHGMGDSTISPLTTVTSEEALLIVIRMYLNRAGYEGEAIETIGSNTFKSSSAFKSVDVVCRSPYDLGDISIVDVTEYEPSVAKTVGSIGSVVNISGKYGINTIKNADITIKYSQNSLGRVDEDDLGVARYDAEQGRMVLLDGVEIDKKLNSLSFTDTSLGEYVIVDKEEWYEEWRRAQTEVRDETTLDTMAYYDVVFLVDDSGSMATNDNENVRATAVYNFIRSLSVGDGFAVEFFTDSLRTGIEYKSVGDVEDWKDLQKSISNLRSDGGTDISGAISRGISILDAVERDTDKMMVLLTDGKQDTKGSSYDESVAELAAEKGYVINVISLGEDVDEEVLSEIADVTGGEYYTSEYADNLIGIYKEIKGEQIGWSSESLDGDKLPDVIEERGMRNQYGVFITCDNNKADTDNDSLNDDIEMGERVVDTTHITTQDIQNGVTAYVYYIMKSDPNFKDSDYDGLDDNVDQFPLRKDGWEEIVDVVDRTTDSNNDGISDYYTDLIYKGYLKTTTGVSFKGYNFGSSADYDGDGVKNGDELVISEADGRIYMQMISNPTKINSDGDEYDDYYELNAFNTDPLTVSVKNSDVEQATNSDIRAASQYLRELEVNAGMKAALFTSNYILGSNYDQVKIYKSALLDMFEEIRENSIKEYKANEMLAMINEINGSVIKGIRAVEYEQYLNAPDKIKDLEKSYDKLKSLEEGVIRNGTPDEISKYTNEVIDLHYEILKQQGIRDKVDEVPIKRSTVTNYVEETFDFIDNIATAAEIIEGIAELNANAEIIKENIYILDLLQYSSDPALVAAAYELKIAAENQLTQALLPVAEVGLSKLIDKGIDVAISKITEASASSAALWVVLIKEGVDMTMGVSETGEEAMQTVALAEAAEIISDEVSYAFDKETAIFNAINDNNLKMFYHLLIIRKVGEQKYLELRELTFLANLLVGWTQDYEEAKVFCEDSISELDLLIDKYSPMRIKSRIK